MSIKLLALDLDDTLLDSQKKISAACVNAIKQARDKGILITLATGRMYQAAVPYALELGIELPLITYQGAWVKNILSGEELFYRPLHTDIARDIMQYLKSQNIYFHSYFNDMLYVDRDGKECREYAGKTAVKAVIVENLLDTLETAEAMEILACIPEEDLLLDIEEKLRIRYADKLHINRFTDKYLEIMDKEANKLSALKVIARHYKIDREEIMAIGDSYNDLEMIEWAGLGVAMSNACQECKELADFITASNEEAGVAEALQKFVLND